MPIGASDSQTTEKHNTEDTYKNVKPTPSTWCKVHGRGVTVRVHSLHLLCSPAVAFYPARP